ncbi:ead/Ea22-like family protein [Cronobacter sakazakii]|nr:ead/Ea22-like family protein [Cronobacter sakazakii]
MTDTAKLKAAAKRASGGEWVKESGGGREGVFSADDQSNGGFIIAEFQGPDAELNREFIALANPTAVLELIAALEAAKKRNAEQEEYVAELEGQRSEILRQARSFREAHEAASEIIRTLERKKTTVTLPATRLWAGRVACFEENEIISLLVSAGINLETGGEA